MSAAGVSVEYLDGDDIRQEFPNTGFSREERDAHIARVGFLASCLERHGVVVVCALIIANFTGVGDCYEPPQAPELRIDTTDVSLNDEASAVLGVLESGAQYPAGRFAS